VLDDAPANGRPGVLETVALGAHPPEDLTPPRQQGVKGLGALVRQRARIRPHALGEEGQRVGVDPIRGGELASGSGEVVYLPRIGHDQRQPGRGERRYGGTLVSARGLQDDERGRLVAQPREKLLNACVIIGRGPALT
jgi:hypothetical protein